MPEPSRRLAPGLCATCAPRSASSRMSSSSSQTAWAAENHGPENADRIHGLGHRHAEDREAGGGLIFCFAYMGLHDEAVLARDVAASDHELLGAVMRDCGRDAEPQPIARIAPLRGKPPQRREDVLGPPMRMAPALPPSTFASASMNPGSD